MRRLPTPTFLSGLPLRYELLLGLITVSKDKCSEGSGKMCQSDVPMRWQHARSAWISAGFDLQGTHFEPFASVRIAVRSNICRLRSNRGVYVPKHDKSVYLGADMAYLRCIWRKLKVQIQGEQCLQCYVMHCVHSYPEFNCPTLCGSCHIWRCVFVVGVPRLPWYQTNGCNDVRWDALYGGKVVFRYTDDILWAVWGDVMEWFAVLLCMGWVQEWYVEVFLWVNYACVWNAEYTRRKRKENTTHYLVP